MYPKLIFDVDYTLYNSKDIPKEENDTEDITENFYTLFTPKVQLIKLLQEYKGEIYLFSNGNLCHVQEVIDKTSFIKSFLTSKIIASCITPIKLIPYSGSLLNSCS